MSGFTADVLLTSDNNKSLMVAFLFSKYCPAPAHKYYVAIMSGMARRISLG